MAAATPFQQLVDIIDAILVKNQTAPQDGEISIHAAEVPSLPQNVFGSKAIGSLLENLKQEGTITAFEYRGDFYVIPKLNRATEKKLLLAFYKAETKNSVLKQAGAGKFWPKSCLILTSCGGRSRTFILGFSPRQIYVLPLQNWGARDRTWNLSLQRRTCYQLHYSPIFSFSKNNLIQAAIFRFKFVLLFTLTVISP